MSREVPLTTAEHDFIVEALKRNVRLDGRGIDELRPLNISFGDEYGHVKVQLGHTSLIVLMSAEVVKPHSDRPFDGIFTVSLELTNMGSPAWENGRQSDLEQNVTRTLDRVIRHSNALDTETLCIMKGQSCWGIRADVHVTNYDGNLIDCACIGIMTGLQHFRCPDAVVKDGKVSVYSIDERVPIPLNLTHRPLTITFHTFHDGELILMDATRKEELAAEGDMVIALNDAGQVCAVYKTAGRPVGAVDVMRKTSIALQKVQEIKNTIQKALDDDQSKRTRRNVGVEANSANDR